MNCRYCDQPIRLVPHTDGHGGEMYVHRDGLSKCDMTPRAEPAMVPATTIDVSTADRMDLVVLPQHELQPLEGTRIVRNVWVIVFRADGVSVKARAELSEQWQGKDSLGLVVLVPYDAIDAAEPWNPSTDAYAR